MNAAEPRATMQQIQDEVDGKRARENSLSPGGFLTPGRRLRALVADDDPTVVAMLQRVLTRKGFDVQTASDGNQALALVRTGNFGVVLTDIEMPLVSGLELFDAVRASTPRLPFIFVTAHPTLESVVDVMNKGAVAYLPKPFEPEQIVEALERATKDLDPPHSGRSSARDAAETFGLALAGLHLNYQPIIRWSTRSTFSYEALMRTSHSEVPHPGAFLDLAEQLGRVQELGRAVRARAASDLLHLGGAPRTLFVNLHPKELLDEQLFERERPLTRLSERFCLEITEREGLSKMDDALERIRALKKLGFRIAIDDIGAGYSGLNSFVDLEPDLVKIDMGLVRGIDACGRRRKLVASLLSLARDLDIEVVAEGVETEAELATLLGLGCDLFQGYLFAKPAVPFVDARIPIEASA